MNLLWIIPLASDPGPWRPPMYPAEIILMGLVIAVAIGVGLVWPLLLKNRVTEGHWFNGLVVVVSSYLVCVLGLTTVFSIVIPDGSSSFSHLMMIFSVTSIPAALLPIVSVLRARKKGKPKPPVP